MHMVTWFQLFLSQCIWSSANDFLHPQDKKRCWVFATRVIWKIQSGTIVFVRGFDMTSRLIGLGRFDRWSNPVSKFRLLGQRYSTIEIQSESYTENMPWPLNNGYFFRRLRTLVVRRWGQYCKNEFRHMFD